MKDKSFHDLHDLAELYNDELEELKDECYAVDYALMKAIRDGSSQDIADAIKHYVAYSFAKHMISTPR
jgi:hypothetical protein